MDQHIPLAEQLRPKSLSDYIGQEHLTGKNKIINVLLEKSKQTGFLPSLILWGPPGVGKTTLARIIANEAQREFLEFSAVNASALTIQKEIKKLKAPLVFIDEIHRFNKAQQDKLLPFVEKGEITLIGATTENPSFEVIRPLLSRSRVLVLNELNYENLEKILVKAVKKTHAKIEKGAKKFLLESANGDARILINTIEIVNELTNETIKIPHIETALQRRSLGFDKNADEFYNTISAFIKSMRSSQVDASLYYLARMVEAGQDPLYIARRMVVFASEDIGMAQPTALVVANEVFRACETIGYPECSINLAHGVVYLASAKKDRGAYDAYQKALFDARAYGNLPIPLKIRNAPTTLMKKENYGKGYEMYDKESYLPQKLTNRKYFRK